MDITAGIDWITMSARVPVDRLENGVLWATVNPILLELDRMGVKMKDVSYRGYHGVDYNGVRYLENDDWSFAECPGEYAQRVFLAWLVVRDRVRVTRLDLHVDVTGEEVGSWWGKSHHQQAHHPRDKYRRAVSEWGGVDGGYTCYIGSPTSDYRVRIYRKDRESPIEYKDWPFPVWRYEIVIRKPYSDRIARNLASLKQPERPSAIASYVYDELHSRGVNPTWKRGDTESIGVPGGRTTTPVEKTIEWLRTSVSPTVLRLIEQGHLADVVRALGLAATSEVARQIIRELSD
jgi:DNA relaxase NicK